jgi:hypothetical protein
MNESNNFSTGSALFLDSIIQLLVVTMDLLYMLSERDKERLKELEQSKENFEMRLIFC